MDNLFETGDQPEHALRDELTTKWKDKPVEELLKAKVESDLYIKLLEKQKDELRNDYLAQRDELLAKAKFEELIDRMNKPTNDNQAPPIANEVIEPKYDPNEFKKMFSETYSEMENQRKEASNFQQVQNKLKERFGDNVASVLQDQQNATGLSKEEINNLARKSPEAFFRIMGLNDQPQRDPYMAPPRNAQRNDHFAPKVEVRDWNYYQKLKQSNPKLYLDPKLTVQMQEDAIALGDRFGMPLD